MTDTHVIIDAGTLEFSEEDLTATGLLVPFGVKARSNLGEFEVDADVFEIPEDPTGAALNIEHKREDVVGGLSRVWQQPEGILAAMRFANTPAGRAAFADAKSGKRKHLSVEAAGVRIRNGRAIAGRIFGAAVVARPAFEGATLLAAEDTTDGSELLEKDAVDTDPAHITLEAEVLPEDITVITLEGATATYTPEADPAEDNPEGGSIVTATATEPGQSPAPAVPSTLLASAPPAPTTATEDIDLGVVFAAMAALKSGTDENSADASTLLAALSAVKTTGTNAIAAAGVLQPAWVGKLWQGRRYTRKYIDLATHLYGGIALGGRKGFKLDQGTALVAKRGQEKTELPSGLPSTGVFSSTRDSYGYAADIAREWFELEGGADVIQAFWEGVVDSYAKITDEDALKAMFDVASKTSVALDRLIAPGSLPAGTPANSAYYPGVVMLIQAIEAISDANDDPGFAVVNPVAWNQLIYTPKDLLPEFVHLAVNVGEGTANVDGKVVVQKAPQSFFPGTVAANPQVMAGAKRSIEFREQGSTPIQIDAENVALHGLDRAIVGYLETFVVRPESLILIGTKP